MENMSFLAVAPEVILGVGALLVLLVDIMWKPRPIWWGWIAGAAIVGALVAAGFQWNEAVRSGEPSLYFSGFIAVDGYSAFAGLVLFTVAGVGLAGSWALIERLDRRGAEFVTLLLIVAAGFHLMAAASDFILMFLGLEIASLSLYAMAGFTRRRIAADEAALKYFLLGAFASAVFLYGIALFYASTGTTNLYQGSAYLSNILLLEPGVLLAGIGLILVGIGFKVSAAPFHMWAPDVYQGAPGGVVGLMAATAKIGGFAALGRILAVPLAAYIDDWAPAIAVIAAVSIIIPRCVAAHGLLRSRDSQPLPGADADGDDAGDGRHSAHCRFHRQGRRVAGRHRRRLPVVGDPRGPGRGGRVVLLSPRHRADVPAGPRGRPGAGYPQGRTGVDPVGAVRAAGGDRRHARVRDRAVAVAQRGRRCPSALIGSCGG
jgi:NADH-quinone oxidoreductase subunit N